MPTKRLLAIFFDWLVISAWGVFLGMVSLSMGVIAPEVLETLFVSWPQSQLVSFVIMGLPIIIGFAILESGKRQGTVGKALMGIMITQDGNRLTFGKAVFRNIVKFLPWEIAHTGFYLFLFRPEWGNLALFLSIFSMVLLAAWILPIFFTKQFVSIPDIICGTHHEFKLAEGHSPSAP